MAASGPHGNVPAGGDLTPAPVVERSRSAELTGPPWPLSARLCVETLADSEAELRDQLAEAIADRDAFRLLAVEAIHRLHALGRDLAASRAAIIRLRAELRASRPLRRVA
jgi:hypothetical protein